MAEAPGSRRVVTADGAGGREGQPVHGEKATNWLGKVFALNPAGPIDWCDLAAGAGYFDQAHFGHEFRAFTGLTPTRYVEVRRRFLREHPGPCLDGWPLPAD